MDAQTTPEEQDTSLAAYTPGPYLQTVWPVIEKVETKVDTFQPSTFEKMESNEVFVIDPMFADFTHEVTCATHEQGYVEPDSSEIGMMTADASNEGSQDTSSEVESSGFVQDQTVEEVLLEPEEPVDVDHAMQSHESAGSQGFDQAAVEQALEQAYAKGCADTREEVELYKRQLEEQYTVLWEDMQVQLTESIHSHERSAVELAFQIAKRMVGSAVESQRGCVVTIIQEAIQAAAGSEIKCIRVSPQDYEFLSLNGYGDRIKIHGEGKLTFVSDETVRHGCIIETSSGQVDFDLDKTWSRMHGKVFQGS